ncbi:uncharacterized protein C8A04DRAFT_27144 [Dichotomopilus funicola]|uniref:Ysc84 actin-binding domain-containing protein n=1 Tax=Dichotomopilus funicola TaxID=1934379 RepID=A0AAN6V5G7_9PEZI|nr:hypothetical protein C8A04DRAFT_27144 [Dichotomopilus funicola]
MSANEKQTPAKPVAQQGDQPYFPPPPPGPPPAQNTQPQPQSTKHPNDTPLPEYDVPAYDPAHPQFAPPAGKFEEDLYNATPTEEHSSFGWGHHRHGHGSDGEGKKKTNRLSAFGEAFTSKVAGPVNALANKFGSEGFLPEALDKECEKAARILRGFCKDGIYSDVAALAAPTPAVAATTPEKRPSSPAGKAKKSRVLLTIPSKVIARAQGLAIFTAVRVGFQATGSSGSGVLLARLPDGSWSPPSGIQITSIGAGFVAGLDIYDCVIVINTREALEMFTKTRLGLGSDLAVTAGPFGAGGSLNWGVPAGNDKNAAQPSPIPASANLAPPPLSSDHTHFQTAPVPESQQGMDREHTDDVHHHLKDDKDKKQADKPDRAKSPFREALTKPVYSYVKSRGFYAGVKIDGTVIASRESANAKFYGQAVSVDKILRAEVPTAAAPAAHDGAHGHGTWPGAARGLFEVLKGAELGWKGQGGQGQTQGQSYGQQQQPQNLNQDLPGAHQTVPPGFGGPSPAFGAPTGTGGAPATSWVPPHPPTTQPPAATTRAGVPEVTTGIQNLGVGSSSSVPPPPAATAGASASSAKAAEAAAESARAHQEGQDGGPPSYSEHHNAEDLPPAYVEDDGRPRVQGDSKAGLH